MHRAAWLLVGAALCASAPATAGRVLPMGTVAPGREARSMR